MSEKSTIKLKQRLYYEILSSPVDRWEHPFYQYLYPLLWGVFFSSNVLFFLDNRKTASMPLLTFRFIRSGERCRLGLVVNRSGYLSAKYPLCSHNCNHDLTCNYDIQRQLALSLTSFSRSQLLVFSFCAWDIFKDRTTVFLVFSFWFLFIS